LDDDLLVPDIIAVVLEKPPFFIQPIRANVVFRHLIALEFEIEIVFEKLLEPFYFLEELFFFPLHDQVRDQALERA